VAGQLSGKAVATATAGFVLLWSGIKGQTLQVTLSSLLKGQNPPKAAQAAPVLGVASAASTPSPATPSGSVASAPVNLSANQNNARMQAAAYGWTGGQWDALYALWTGESGFDNNAQNPNSTAYGIAQFLDQTWGPYGPKTSDPTLQIRYGLRYIKGRYGNPQAAYAAWLSRNPHWY
jgi:Transglycosylase SLT domain